VRLHSKRTRTTWLWQIVVVGTAALGVVVALAAWTRVDPPGHQHIADRLTQVVAASAPTAAGAQIEIVKHKFSRSILIVPVGTTVTWVNHDEDVHTVTSTTRVFTSRGIDTDDKYSYTFTKAGEYQYFCTLHPLMTGKVIVQ